LTPVREALRKRKDFRGRGVEENGLERISARILQGDIYVRVCVCVYLVVMYIIVSLYLYIILKD